jgi:hypothetical protein
MKIDALDKTLICEYNDLQEALSYFKETRKIPAYLEQSILEYILEELNVESGESGSIEEYLEILPREFIQKSINDINSMFTGNQEVQYQHFYLSYLLYYLPANVFKIWKPLLDLHLRSTLKPELRVLDIGTGPGSVPVGIIEFYRSLANSYNDISFVLSFTLVEAEKKFLDIATSIIGALKTNLPPNLSVNIEKIYCHIVSRNYANDDLQQYDLITMSNFLTSNEKDNHKDAPEIVNRFKDNLAEDGALIIIEPGDNISCRALKNVRNAVVGENGFNLYSPCIGIWEEKSSYNCSCFNMVRSFWEIPKIYQYLVGKGLTKASRIDVPFNYVVLRLDGLRKYDISTNYQHYTKVSDLPTKMGEKVNVAAIIRSVIDFLDEHDRLIILLCDGSCSFGRNGHNDVSISLNSQQLHSHGINVPLIAGEKITLKKVIVSKNGKGISLEFNKYSSLMVDY